MAAASVQPKETECAVCTNDFTAPKILPCGHLLCRQCVISWVDTKPNAGCPLCRFPIAEGQGHSNSSSSNTVDALPTDFVMEALVESTTAISKSHICCVCVDVRAEFICMQCLDMFCPSCCRIHKKMSMSRSHDVESLLFVTAERLAANRRALCTDHGEKQSLFCSDHGISFCTSCGNTKHRSCANIKYLDYEMKSAEESVRHLMDILLIAERELHQSMAEVDKRLQEVDDREQEDIAEVDKLCKSLQKLVEGFRNIMNERSRRAYSDVKKCLHDVKSSLGQRLGIVTSHKRIVSRTTAIAPRPTLIHATKNLQDRVKSLDLNADLKINVWVDPLLCRTRCQDVVGRIEKELQMAAKQSPNFKESNSTQPQTFWLQWVEAAFPDLDSSAHFLPPVNPVTTGQSSAGQPLAVHGSDAKDDAALQRVLCCLQKMSEQNGEVLVGMSQLQFGQHLGQPCYSATAAHLLESSNLRPALSRSSSAGDCDALLIHRQYGLVALEIKCFGGSLKKHYMSQMDLEKDIRRNVKDAVSQLAKTKAILSYLVSDVTPGLRITKTIAFPYLTARQVQQAISDDTHLTQDVCRCLGTTDPANITGLCLCSDQLSDPRTPCDVSSDVLRELGNWWQRRVAVSGPDSHMTRDIYKILVARLCGPATTVAVPCTSPPRLCVKTLGQAVSLTGECYTAFITLFPEQVYLLNTAPPRLFVSGPPGTGKTEVLLLMAVQWLRCGNDVYIVSTWWGSRAVCILVYHLLLQYVNSQETGAVQTGQPRLLQYDFYRNVEEVGKAVNDLSQAARGGSLYVIADEAVEYTYMAVIFRNFCGKLLTQVPRVHLWATSCYHVITPAGWRVEYLTRPLRSPPAVVREVQQDKAITETREVQAYSERGVSDLTDGPPVRHLYHRGEGHSDYFSGYFSGCLLHHCVTCGREVASFLHSLRVGVPVNVAATATTVSTNIISTRPPCLQWRDVLVLCLGDPSDQSGVVTGLREAGIPVRVMKDDDTEDVATARSDVVWVANGNRVRGLERNVVVCLDDVTFNTTRLHFMSRCTSQLVVVSPDH